MVGDEQVMYTELFQSHLYSRVLYVILFLRQVTPSFSLSDQTPFV